MFGLYYKPYYICNRVSGGSAQPLFIFNLEFIL